MVLIDPPFEAPEEVGTQSSARSNARLSKWPTGTYIVWRPIREARPTPVFSMQSPRSARQTSCGSNSTSARADRRARPGAAARAGLLVVNPPHTLIDEARTLLPWLAQTSGRGGDGQHVCAWLTEPR